MLFVFLCLTLLCMTISRHIHAAVTSFHSFYGYLIFHCINVPLLFILCSVDGDLDCFHVLAIVNNTTMNIGVYISFQITVFFEYMPMSGIAGSYGSSIFTLSGISILLSIMVVLSHQKCRRISFSPQPLSPSIYYLYIVWPF